jgi:hypothetical protein
MVTVTRDEYMRDAGAVVRRSKTEGPIGIVGEDGKVGLVISTQTEAIYSGEDVIALVRAVWPIPCEDSDHIPTCRYCRTQRGTLDGQEFEHAPTCAWIRLKNVIGA